MNNSPIIISLLKDRNNMNIEEKAKGYVLEKLEENGCRNFHGGECVEHTFIAGYTQVVTDLSAENDKLREALRELVGKVNMLAYSIVEEDIEVNHDFFAEIMDSLAKAKQLITE